MGCCYELSYVTPLQVNIINEKITWFYVNVGVVAALSDGALLN